MSHGIRAILVVLFTCVAMAIGAAADPPEVVTAFEVLVVESGSGEAVPGAEVTLSLEADDGTSTHPRTTDGHGRAKFEFMDAGRYALEVKAASHVCVLREGIDVHRSAPALRVELEAGVPFSGSVRTQSGEPVGLATVLVRAGGVFAGVTDRKPGNGIYAKAWTDREGRFHVPGIPDGSIATVVVRARGHEEVRVAVRAVEGTVRPTPLELVLPPGGRVAGVVADPSGHPVSGAAVYVVREGDEDLKEDPRARLQQGDVGDGVLDAGPTDRKGRFSVDGLALNRKYLACAYAPGFSRSEWTQPLVVTAPGERVRVLLTLRAEERAVEDRK